MKNKSYLLFVSGFLFIFLIGLIIASEDIRPANQREDRGVDVQIRPANQMNLPSNGNGGYVPTQGSHYNSGYMNPSENLHAVLNFSNEVNSTSINENVTSSSAIGAATFVLDEQENTLMYNVTFEGLTSNETSADISGPALSAENSDILFELPPGNPKIGVWNINDAIKKFILEGKSYINIHSLFFPDGEIRGQLEKVISI